LGANSQFAAKKGALVPDGSWMISWYLNNTDFPMGFASIPSGPEGRKSMFNGLADSIWIGSQNQDQAWEWIKFLGSPACQEIVGTYAVVFPAIPSAVEIAVASHQEKGVNVAAFSNLTETEGATFLFPVTDYASQISDIMTKAMDRIFIGGEPAATVLPEADAEVDGLF
jgi:multiple sugar transport system substrate-binding protein